MSYWATNWVFREVRGLSPVQRLVLLHLADSASYDDCCYGLSQKQLAEECEISARSVVDALSHLQKMGLIASSKEWRCDEASGRARRKVNVYRLFLGEKYTRRHTGENDTVSAGGEINAESAHLSDQGRCRDISEVGVLSPENGGVFPVREICADSALLSDQGKLSENQRLRSSAYKCDLDDSASETPLCETVSEQAKSSVCAGQVISAADCTYIPLKEKIFNPPTPQGEKESGTRFPSVTAGEDSVRDLLSACLPDSMRMISGKHREKIFNLLSTIVERGWKPNEVRFSLEAVPLPNAVSSMGALVAYRLEELPLMPKRSYSAVHPNYEETVARIDAKCGSVVPEEPDPKIVARVLESLPENVRIRYEEYQRLSDEARAELQSESYASWIKRNLELRNAYKDAVDAYKALEAEIREEVA